MDYYAWMQLLEGAWTTAWISLVSIVLGVAIGLAIALVRMAKIPFIDQFLGVYVSWARATPLVTLALFIFLSFPAFGINLDKHLSAILCLTLNTSAFNAEIWRNAFFELFKRPARSSGGHWHVTPRLFPPHYVPANGDCEPTSTGKRDVFSYQRQPSNCRHRCGRPYASYQPYRGGDVRATWANFMRCGSLYVHHRLTDKASERGRAKSQ